MSRWFVLCLYCDSWSCETDDLADGAVKGDEHAQECVGRTGPRPWPGRGLMRRVSPKRSKLNRTYEPVRRSILDRDDHGCLVCGRLAGDVHHRKQKSLGGTDNSVNLVTLCRACHSDVHDDPQGVYRMLGYLLWSWETESTVPVWASKFPAWVMPTDVDCEFLPAEVARLLGGSAIDLLDARLNERDRLFTLVHNAIPRES